MPARRARAAAAVIAVAAAGLAPLAPAPDAAAGVATFYRPADGVLHIAGHGYGHGHGMSQWGAYGGAESGKTYQQILAWYYANPSFGSATGSIKVQITSDGRGRDRLYDTEVKPVAGLTATDAAGSTVTLPTVDATGATYDLYRAAIGHDGVFHVQAHSGSTWTDVPPPAPATTWTGWVRFTATGGILDNVQSDGSTEYYREALELDRTSGTVGVTVNRLSLEHYLMGVVSSEMPCGWTPTVNGTKRLDALEAQAVASRSYADWRRQHPRSSLVDIVDSTSDQAYHGYSAERTALSACPWTNAGGSKTSAEVAAVNATAGQIMLDSSGHAIFAQYSASNGGYETSGSQSYLPSRPDAWDGVPTESWNSHAWTDTVTAGQIQAAYPTIGTFQSLSATAREALSGTDQNGNAVGEQWGGRITQLTLTGSAGSTTTTGASFAAAMGLMSPWFTVVVQRPAAPATVSATPGDGQATVTWAPPPTDGGGGIRSYTVSAGAGGPTVTVAGSSQSSVVTGLRNDTPYAFSVRASNTAGSGATSTSPLVTPSARVVFHPLPPTRIFDTDKSGGALRGNRARAVKVTGVGGVPAADVTDVALDVVALDPTTSGSLTVAPHSGPRPADPQLTWTKGARVNSLVWVKVGTGGLVDITSRTGSTHLFVDVQGYYTQATGAGDVLAPTTPTVLFDSRKTGGVPRGATRSFAAVGNGVPSGATAAVVQITAVRPAKRNYVRVWGTGAPKPAVYDLYAPAGAYTSATAVVPLTSAGTISVAPTYATNLVVTLEGWFTTASQPASGVTSLVTPARRVLRATLRRHATATIRLGLPAGAGSVELAISGAGAHDGAVFVWPTGSALPREALVHLGTAAVTTTVVVPVGSGGRVALRNWSSASAHLVVDVLGWAAA